MKTKITFALLSVFLSASVFAQGKTAVYAANSDISDNLDLRAVASIFGDSKDLADFEYRLNDPNIQISNLDLNNDNQVDYLRVVEMVENNTHMVVLQSVLQEDVYQDVATIVLSKKKNKQVHIQIIGDPYMYGSNYIYEPVYVVRPPLYSNFWVNNYRPYRSYYGWNRYPTFFTYWSPYSYGHYHQNVYGHINHNNYYNYSTNIYNVNANNYYNKYRNNGYEQKYPNRNFAHRTSQTNRYEYDRIQKESGRSPQVTTGARPSSAYRNESRVVTQQQTSASTARSVMSNRAATSPNSAVSTSRPAISTNTNRPVSNSTRPTTTTSKAESNITRPGTSSAKPITNSARPASNIVRPSSKTARPSANTSRAATTSNRTGTNSQSLHSRNSQRSPASSQNAQQRKSNISARSSQ